MAGNFRLPFSTAALLDALRLNDDACARRLLKYYAHRALEQQLDLLADWQRARSGSATEAARAAHERRFFERLHRLLRAANYVLLDRAQIEAAFHEQALIDLRLDIDFARFRTLLVYVSGERQKTERVPIAWSFDLLNKDILLNYYERVFVFAEYEPRGQEGARENTIKLFADVPRPDLEMLLPGGELRMRLIDKLLIGGPAVVGIGTLISQSVHIYDFCAGLVLYALSLLGLYQSPVVVSALKAEGALAISAIVAIGMFIYRRFNAYQLTKLRYHKKLVDNLYFRVLDNGEGALHRVAWESAEEECKEIILAWHFLSQRPMTAEALKAAVERWCQDALSIACEFDVEDAVGKLQELGLGRTGADGCWHVLPAAHAASAIEEHMACPLQGLRKEREQFAGDQ